MGGSPTKPDAEFARSLEDNHFGRVELYRRNDIEYIMKKVFTFVHRDAAADHLLRNLEFMENHRHEGLPPVHQLTRRKEQQLCIEYDRVELYIDYYNYTLEALVDSEKVLEIGELWYALHTLADLGGMLFKQGIKCCPFRLDSVFVSLKGTPCVYLMEGWALEEATESEAVRALGLLILSLASVRKLADHESYEVELQAMANRSELLAQLLQKMLAECVSFDEIATTIDQLTEKAQIKLAASLKLSKFKALLPMARLCNVISCKTSVPTEPNLPEPKQPANREQPKLQEVVSVQPRASHLPPLSSLKLLETRKQQNQEQEKRMKQRMEQLLGKENLSIGVNTLNLTSTMSRGAAESSKKPSVPLRTQTSRNSTSRKIRIQK